MNRRAKSAFAGFFSIIALSSLVGCLPLAAQQLGVWTGRVLDPAGMPVTGAAIRVSIGATGAEPIALKTNELGEFSIPLSRGSIQVEVNASGFRPLAMAKAAAVEGSLQEDIHLQLSERSDALTVAESLYQVPPSSAALKGDAKLADIPQSVTVLPREFLRDKLITSMAEAVQYIPGVTAAQGEGNRDQLVLRGNNTTADFFVNGVRDDVQYLRDVYNLEQVEALKGPNAMIFGRGGGGGVINRVTKSAGFGPMREVTLQGGQWNNQRAGLDLNEMITNRLAFRMNGMYERSDSFRRGVNLRRYGVNPTVSWRLTDRTMARVHYERFHDGRVADRGVPSFLGRPLAIERGAFFGDPAQSPIRADVNLGSATLEHAHGTWNVRNHFWIGDYDKFYQNYVPGAVNAARTDAALSSYHDVYRRRNTFNQTDVSNVAFTGRFRHALVMGAELGRQSTFNQRNTGYFNNVDATVRVALANPLLLTPLTFRPSATDANNNIGNTIAAGYAQDQVELSRRVRVVVGLRFDRFNLQFRNNRTGANLERLDYLWSPRAGVIVKPVAPLSLYLNYSVSYLPSAGDQFASLTNITQQVKPERFNNYEAGAKWDLRRGLALTAAVYRLDRTNTRAVDPNDPTRILQTGAQRSNGAELGWNGAVTRRWSVAGGYGYQDAYLSAASVLGPAGARVAIVPKHSFSVWNNVQVLRRVSAGLGLVSRSDMFAGIDNTVKVPGFAKVDAALYYSLTEQIRLQANVENLTGVNYHSTAHSNNNISPGLPRMFRLALSWRF